MCKWLLWPQIKSIIPIFNPQEANVWILFMCRMGAINIIWSPFVIVTHTIKVDKSISCVRNVASRIVLIFYYQSFLCSFNIIHHLYRHFYHCQFEKSLITFTSNIAIRNHTFLSTHNVYYIQFKFKVVGFVSFISENISLIKQQLKSSR